MAKHRIFTIGCSFPGDEFEDIDFNSDATLLDANIILFEPTLGNAWGTESYGGKMLLSENSSFIVKQHLDHWRSEIVAAVNAGKLVIVYLSKPIVCYRHTGEKRYSGTGRSRQTTNLVTEVSSYEAIPNLNKVTAKSGTEIRIDKNAKFFAPYWSEFSVYSPYEAEIEGNFKHILLRSRTGDRIVSAALSQKNGSLLFLPPLRYDEEEFSDLDENSHDSYWTDEALQFGKRLVAALGALSASLKQSGEATPPPSWAAESKFRLASESRLESEISACSSSIATLQAKSASLQDKLLQAGSLRRLLFEQGKPLEAAILEALRLLGFDAQPFADGESEFDAVFVSPEGRCLGEAEGKDNKPINIDKFSQLERNLQEDFASDNVTEYAKGALFGNAFRLLPLQDRGDFFTNKCMSAAKRVKAALVRTPDLFAPAKYMKESPSDVEYARHCREAIFRSDGEVVVFPPAPTTETSVLEERPQAEGEKPNV